MPQDFGSAIPLLCCSGGALFFAVAAVLFFGLFLYSGRKRQQLRATLTGTPLRSVATLRPGQGLVRLRGVISQVPEPVPPFLDIAVLRLTLRTGVREERRRIRAEEEKQEMDRVQARPFLLDDGTGTVWVDPTHLDRFLLGEGLVPTGQERLDALQAVGLPPGMAEGHIQVWALRAGQEVTVVGTVQERDGRMVIAKGKNQPLVVSPGDIPELAAQTGRQSQAAWIWGGVVGVVVLCLLTVAGVTLVRALSVLLAGR